MLCIVILSMMMLGGVASQCSFILSSNVGKNYDNCADISIANGKVFWRVVEPNRNFIEIAVRADGAGYLAAGFGERMVGSKAVVSGWNGLTVEGYSMGARSSQGVVPTNLNLNTTASYFERNGGVMTLIFSIPYGISPVPADTAVSMIFATHVTAQIKTFHNKQRIMSVDLHLPKQVPTPSNAVPSITAFSTKVPIPIQPNPSPTPTQVEVPETVYPVEIGNRVFHFKAKINVPNIGNNIILYWNVMPNNKEIQLAIQGDTLGWIGFAFSSVPGQMEGSHAIIGMSGKDIKEYYLGGKDVSDIVPSSTLNVRESKIASVNGVTTFACSIDKKVKKDSMMNVLFAYSTSPVIRHHDGRTSVSIDFSLGHVVNSGSKDHKLHLLHGSLMSISWLCIFPFSIMIARFGKSHESWFLLHRCFNAFGLIMIIVAYSLALYFGSRSQKAHFSIGTIAVGLAVLQPLNAIFRPAKDAKNRYAWVLLHRFSGLVAAILGITNCYIGLHVYATTASGIWALAIAVGGALLCIAVVLQIIHITKQNPNVNPTK